MKNQTSHVVQKMGIMLAFTTAMMGFMLSMLQNYATYSYTDLAHIDPGMMAMCMFLVNCVGVVVTLVSGAIVSVTRSKLGRYRFWLLVGPAIAMFGGFLIFFNVGDSMILKAVVITIGYLLANSTMDFVFASRNTLIGIIADKDTDARNTLIGRSMQGQTACMIISGFAVVPLVRILGSGNQTVGFLLAQAIFTVVVMAGSIWLITATKDYDPDNSNAEKVKAQRVPFTEMIKAVITNRLARTVLVSDVVRFTGYYVLFNMMVYQCTQVIGDMVAMSYVLTASNFCAFLGSSLAPIACEKLGGRKRTVQVFGVLSGIAFLSIGIFGKTLWGFTISCSVAFFLFYFLNALDPMLYMDAGEYWLDKTGKDTRPYLISMYNVAVKVALSLSSLVLGAVLVAINYQPNVILTGADATKMTMVIGLAPGLAYLIPVLIMLRHNVSDKEMGEIIKRNVEKYSLKSVE